jgi:hypothetical protein
MDFSVLADRGCLVVFAAAVLCSDRGVEAHKMGYDYGGIAHLTAKGRGRADAAGQTRLSKAAAGRALRRLEEAGLIISDGDMPWADDAEVLAVYGRNLREVQALSDRDHGRIDDAEGKAQVLLDEFRDTRDIAFLDFSNVEAIAAE